MKRQRTREEKIKILTEIEQDKADGMSYVQASKKQGIAVSQHHDWSKKLGRQYPSTEVEFITPSPTQSTKPRAAKKQDTSKAFIFVGTPTQVAEFARTL